MTLFSFIRRIAIQYSVFASLYRTNIHLSSPLTKHDLSDSDIISGFTLNIMISHHSIKLLPKASLTTFSVWIDMFMSCAMRFLCARLFFWGVKYIWHAMQDLTVLYNHHLPLRKKILFQVRHDKTKLRHNLGRPTFTAFRLPFFLFFSLI